MRVAIIGAGAAGLMAGGLISRRGHEVTIFDASERVGKKINITGKGRCNLTNACSNEQFLENIVNGRDFFRGALSRFTPFDTINFFEELGVPTKVERGNRVFPVSDSAFSISNALEKFCSGCNIKLNHRVKDVYKDGEEFVVDNRRFDRLVIATGGKSYPSTGSTGDGYIMAKKFGHTIIEPRPALVPIMVEDDYTSLAGLSLKNVTLHCKIKNNKLEQFGEMLFMPNGITGPIVLTMSSFINRQTDIEIYLDLKSALSHEQLEKRLLREFENAKNKNIITVMHTLLPKSLADFTLKKINLNDQRKVNSITASERKAIVDVLKRWTIKYKMLYPIESAVVTSGGVFLKEVNPKSLQSKLCPGLYFAGEVLDIDALTGGFNLQIAFSTAFSLSQDF